MLQARFNLITADPDRMADTVGYIKSEIRPAVESLAVEGYGDTAVPWLAETAGFCGALLLVDWNSGHSISETIWDSPKTLAASRSVAARVRVETVKSTGCVIRALEEYNLVFNTARIGGV